MKILLTVFDLYRSTGGGQTAYRAIIENRPGDTFYYFIRDEDENAPRPANARPIPFAPIYRSRTGSLAHSDFDALLNGLYLETYNLAASVRRALGAGHFDVVDSPDFHQYSLFIRRALADNGVTVGKVALALHGVLTNSFLTNWPINGASDLHGRLRQSTANIPFLYAVERLQYSTCDIPYTCVGAPYQKRWRGYLDREINFFDPMNCVAAPARCTFEPRPGAKVNLVFIGRRERIKGPDLFFDLAAWVPPDLIDDIVLIGPDGPNSAQASSSVFIDPIVHNRRLHAKAFEGKTPSELADVFRARTLVVAPSRFDTLNFVVLEALSHGCPVVVSRNAGVSSYMPSARPDVPLGVFNIDCAREGGGVIADWLEHYDERRTRLVDMVNAGALAADKSGLATIYEDRRGVGKTWKALVDDLYVRARTFNPPSDKLNAREQVAGQLRKLPTPVKRAGKAALGATRSALGGAHRFRQRLTPARIQASIRRRLRESAERASGLGIQALSEARKVAGARDSRAHVRTIQERTGRDLEGKIAALKQQIGERRVDRVTYYRELARLERRAGRPLVSAAYELRIMRWLGRDVFGDLPDVVDTLRHGGFAQEAEVVEAMHAPNADAACEAWLHRRFEALRDVPRKPWQVADDRRPSDATPRVSIVVSLYNAESKLDLFLRMVSQDRLLQRGEAELILVDSGSPTNEARVFKAFMQGRSLPVFYGRSEKRETIQAAWNRGILEARGKYLTFLGADEAVTPFASEILAAKLDAEPETDWVVSDTIVTNADKRQVYDSDVMKYDRKDFMDVSHYLDCTYLNYVGCMYRLSVHERFGYYDETFGAAGDNEFKNRVLPHIRCAYIPKMLGIFNNFPEERTTQSPRAEIEDVRAWYVFRTLAGMRYAFQKRPLDEAIALLAATLRYRKAYTGGHISTDFQLAQSVGALVAERSNDAKWRGLNADIGVITRAIEGIEVFDPAVFLDPPAIAARKLQAHVIMSARRVKQFERPHGELLPLPDYPNYDVFNDNRFEQHYWCW